jgi:D-glycerate 3-kinase
MARDVITPSCHARAAVDATLDAVSHWLGPQARASPLRVGISGLQGSGKSTFARQLAAAANARGIACETLTLDDFYFGRRERARLARDVHPLLATRGVPGTHEVDLLVRTLDDLAFASDEHPVRIPRFDKGRDTRLPPSRWRRVAAAPRLILLEGWCVGVPPQPARALARPVNVLERGEDHDRHWRSWVNARLADAYVTLWQRLDRLILLQAPDFAVVARWRGEQERALRARHAPHALDAAALKRFLMHYERLSRHALRTLPAIADLRLVLDANRSVRAIRHAPGARA